MFSLINTTVSVHFHKIYKNSFHPYFFICCYIQNCMFAKIFYYRSCGVPVIPVTPFSQWHGAIWLVEFFKNKNRGVLIDYTTWHDRLVIAVTGDLAVLIAIPRNMGGWTHVYAQKLVNIIDFRYIRFVPTQTKFLDCIWAHSEGLVCNGYWQELFSACAALIE